MEEVRQYYKFKPDEVFRRVTVNSLLALMLEVAKLEIQEADEAAIDEQQRHFDALDDADSAIGNGEEEEEEEYEEDDGIVNGGGGFGLGVEGSVCGSVGSRRENEDVTSLKCSSAQRMTPTAAELGRQFCCNCNQRNELRTLYLYFKETVWNRIEVNLSGPRNRRVGLARYSRRQRRRGSGEEGETSAGLG